MQDMEKSTCLSFEETDQLEDAGSVLSISNALIECYATFGHGQMSVMNLADGCVESDIIAHLLMHVLGFHHETSRTDRDSYVTVHWENVQPGMEDRFSVYSDVKTEHLNDPYDFESIMHYRRNAYSTDMTKATVTHRLFPDIILGNKHSLSEMDVTKINRVYCEPSGEHDNAATWYISRPPPTGYERLVGNCAGNIILGPMSLDLEQCAEKCNSTTGCRGFAYSHSKQNLCFLKSEACSKPAHIPGYTFYRRLEIFTPQVAPSDVRGLNLLNKAIDEQPILDDSHLLDATVTPSSAMEMPIRTTPSAHLKCRGKTSVVKVSGDKIGGNGHILSPNYNGGMYFPNDECHWSIRGQPGSCLKLHFVKFLMGDGCQSATTLIYDGPTNSSERLTALCGRTIPPDITIASSEAFITLRTGRERTDKGFHIEASLADCPAPRCHGKLTTLTDSMGYMMSPYYGIEDVMPTDYENCNWLIRAKPGNLIK